jgi:hypothetical protein
MTHFLFTYQDDFDNQSAGGFAVLTEYQKDILLAKIKKNFRKGGTVTLAGEDRDYDDYHDLMACINVKTISKEEYDTLSKLFGDNNFGFLGPIDETDIEYDDDEDDNEDEDDEADTQEEFKANADKVVKLIKDEFHVEESVKNGNYSRFVWKPTPITELEIAINSFSNNGDEEVEVTLKKNNRSIEYEFFDIYDYSHSELKNCVKKFLDKTRTF